MSLACLHLQKVVDGWNVAFAESGMNYIKFIEDHQAIVEAKAARPDCLFMVRQMAGNTGPWFEMAAQGQAYYAMCQFVATFYDSAVRAQVDAAEGLNEEHDTNNHDKEYLALLIDIAFVRVLRDAYDAHLDGAVPVGKFAPELEQVLNVLIYEDVPPHEIRPVVFCAAIGNPSKPAQMTEGERGALLLLGQET